MTLLAALAMTTLASANRLVSLPNLPEFPPVGGTSVAEIDGIDPGMPFDKVIPSWNIEPAAGASILVEARATGDDRSSKWFTLAKWALSTATAPRESVDGQKDADGNVFTDTLSLKQKWPRLDLRLTLTNNGPETPRLKLFTLSFSDSTQKPGASVSTKSEAWGKTIEVPQRAQGNYPNGGVLCSPTSVSMVLWHWSNQLGRPELNKDVPEIVDGVWDAVYKGAGNWPFNTAYVGSFPGLRSYVTRFNGIQDLERWIAAGIPVICSVQLDILMGREKPRDSGHLVVLVGFDANGDPVFNDPAHRDQVRKTYTRANFEKAWLTSSRTVYLVYPEGTNLPADPDRLWSLS